MQEKLTYELGFVVDCLFFFKSWNYGFHSMILRVKQTVNICVGCACFQYVYVFTKN